MEADLIHASRTCVLGPRPPMRSSRRRIPSTAKVHQRRGFPRGGPAGKKGSLFGGDVDNILLMPISTFDSMWPQVKNGHGDTIHIATVPKDPSKIQEMTDRSGISVPAGLKASEPNDFAIFTSDAQLKSFTDTSGIAGAMILIASTRCWWAASAMNIMLVTVTERTRDRRTKALGATRNDIAMQFLVEAVSLTGVGGAIGIATAWAFP